MPRPLSAPALRAVHAAETGEVIASLLTLSHPSLPEPIRVVNNAEGVISQGRVYLACPFELTLPQESEEAPPNPTVRIANADLRISQAIEVISGGPIEVELRLVLLSSPDKTEAGPYLFALRSITCSEDVIEGQLRYEDIAHDAYPSELISPSSFPALFA